VSEQGPTGAIQSDCTCSGRLVRKAAGGDHRTLRLVFDMWFRLHPDGKQEPSAFELMRSLAAETARAIEKEKAEAVPDEED